jgi:beta-lactamase class A
LNQVYTDLGLTPPGDNASYTISAKDYSLFFRVLYNATYLNDTDSEKALSILSQVTFASGLVAGLPSGTVVAHKYGEYVNGNNDHVDSIELHDCGIIYSKKSPYLLCVMTKGQNLNGLQDVIASISKLVYTDIYK